MIRLALVLALLASPALAAPPVGADAASPMAGFYRSLIRPDVGGSCCDASDCRETVARSTPRGWQAQTPYGEWVDVPDAKVIRDRDHPAGRAVMCWMPSLGVLCLVPPGAGI